MATEHGPNDAGVPAGYDKLTNKSDSDVAQHTDTVGHTHHCGGGFDWIAAELVEICRKEERSPGIGATKEKERNKERHRTFAQIPAQTTQRVSARTVQCPTWSPPVADFALP